MYTDVSIHYLWHRGRPPLRGTLSGGLGTRLHACVHVRAPARNLHVHALRSNARLLFTTSHRASVIQCYCKRVHKFAMNSKAVTMSAQLACKNSQHFFFVSSISSIRCLLLRTATAVNKLRYTVNMYLTRTTYSEMKVTTCFLWLYL